MKIVRRIAWVTVGFTYFLIALGGTVRVSDSGLSCPDWPLCYGRPYAPPEIHALLEESHRYTASIVSILIIALAISALIWARNEKQVLIPALMAPFFLVIQIVLGGLTVLWKLPPTIITAPTSAMARPNPASNTVASENRVSHNSVIAARYVPAPSDVNCSRYSAQASATI